ncbi:MAG: hypothetical protein J0G94_03200 [Sphingomonadales bacterium]|nr:hypothetical protein [Sphingomonadales bacterium]
MSEPSVASLLADEYLLLQKRIEEFDARLLTIKAWSVSFAAAAIGLAWQQSSPRLLLVSAISACAFWMVETVVKTHQRAHYPRLSVIEDHFAGRCNTPPMQISASWRAASEAKGRLGRYLTHARYANVCLPHVLIAALALGLFFLAPPVKEPVRQPRLSILFN